MSRIDPTAEALARAEALAGRIGPGWVGIIWRDGEGWLRYGAENGPGGIRVWPITVFGREIEYRATSMSGNTPYGLHGIADTPRKALARLIRQRRDQFLRLAQELARMDSGQTLRRAIVRVRRACLVADMPV